VTVPMGSAVSSTQPPPERGSPARSPLASVPETPAAVPPLAGFTVGVTAARRAEELIALLERRGATVIHAPALRIVPLADDTELLAASRALAADPPDVVVATTGIGFRGWLEAAETWGLAEGLLAGMRSATLLARGPKARGAIRAAGLTETWSPPSESSSEVLDRLLADDLTGRHVAVQLHGEPLPDFCAALRMAGAEVTEVPVYRWMMPMDVAPLDRLIEAVAAGAVDALTFTSAPAAACLLERAEILGLGAVVTERLREEVLAMCVGPVTAGPLHRHGIMRTVWPVRARLGALVRRLTEEMPGRTPALTVAGHLLEVRGHAVVVDGELRPVAPAPMALLRELARRPGGVVARAELLAALPGGGADDHAVDMAIARLRGALGTPAMVQTIVKRGYRLALTDATGCLGADP
jgi:uroporphyrinogen-III synthase